MQSIPESVSVDVGPMDNRHRWWSKVIRHGDSIPTPDQIEGANSFPQPFLKKGDDELMAGDFIIHGEEIHHRHQRGWGYQIGYMNQEGDLEWVTPTRENKAALKEAGMDKALLTGSGDLAACVRVAHGLRQGLDAGIPAMAKVEAQVQESSTDYTAALDACEESSSNAEAERTR